jgi:splicing factor U2AF subunit
LNGFAIIPESNLKVQRASIGYSQSAPIDMMNVNAMSMLAGTVATDDDAGRVVQLMNMITTEELMDTEEYNGMFFCVA